MAEYARPVIPRGVFANDAGVARDASGVEGLAILDQQGIPAAAVATLSARIGDALSTYHDGLCSHVNRTAAERGLQVGMRASAAAHWLLVS